MSVVVAHCGNPHIMVPLLVSLKVSLAGLYLRLQTENAQTKQVRPDQPARICHPPLTRDVGLQGRRNLAAALDGWSMGQDVISRTASVIHHVDPPWSRCIFSVFVGLSRRGLNCLASYLSAHFLAHLVGPPSLCPVG